MRLLGIFENSGPLFVMVSEQRLQRRIADFTIRVRSCLYGPSRSVGHYMPIEQSHERHPCRSCAFRFLPFLLGVVHSDFDGLFSDSVLVCCALLGLLQTLLFALGNGLL